MRRNCLHFDCKKTASASVQRFTFVTHIINMRMEKAWCIELAQPITHATIITWAIILEWRDLKSDLLSDGSQNLLKLTSIPKLNKSTLNQIISCIWCPYICRALQNPQILALELITVLIKPSFVSTFATMIQCVMRTLKLCSDPRLRSKQNYVLSLLIIWTISHYLLRVLHYL